MTLSHRAVMRMKWGMRCVATPKHAAGMEITEKKEVLGAVLQDQSL